MVKIVFKEEFQRSHNIKPVGPKVKASLNVVNSVLSAIEVICTNKTIKAARLLKELVDIFLKKSN